MANLSDPHDDMKEVLKALRDAEVQARETVYYCEEEHPGVKLGPFTLRPPRFIQPPTVEQEDDDQP